MSASGLTYEQAISRDNFRTALEECISTKIRGPLRRRLWRRALRDPDIFEKVYAETAPKVAEGVVAAGWGFDWDSIVDWLTENWGEILKIILTIIPFLI